MVNKDMEVIKIVKLKRKFTFHDVDLLICLLKLNDVKYVHSVYYTQIVKIKYLQYETQVLTSVYINCNQ